MNEADRGRGEMEPVGGSPAEETAAQLRARLGRGSDAPARARAMVRQILPPSENGAQVIADAQLVATELVTNALRHGEGEIELKLHREANRLAIEVVDQGDRATEVTPRRPDDEGGWGLQLVGALSDRWGVYEGTTHVWAEVSL